MIRWYIYEPSSYEDYIELVNFVKEHPLLEIEIHNEKFKDEQEWLRSEYQNICLNPPKGFGDISGMTIELGKRMVTNYKLIDDMNLAKNYIRGFKGIEDMMIHNQMPVKTSTYKKDSIIDKFKELTPSEQESLLGVLTSH